MKKKDFRIKNFAGFSAFTGFIMACVTGLSSFNLFSLCLFVTGFVLILGIVRLVYVLMERVVLFVYECFIKEKFLAFKKAAESQE